MSTNRQRREETARLAPRSTCLSFVYVITVAIVSFVLAGLVMAQVDLYELLGLYGAELPLIDVQGEDIPKWALQLVVGVIIFFVLQPLTVIITGLFSRGRREDEFGQAPSNPWDS